MITLFPRVALICLATLGFASCGDNKREASITEAQAMRMAEMSETRARVPISQEMRQLSEMVNDDRRQAESWEPSPQELSALNSFLPQEEVQ